MTRRIINRTGALALALSISSLAQPVAAEPAPFESGLQSPEQRSFRDSAYGLPTGMWSVDVSALGVTGEELYGSIGVRAGLGAGIDLELNLAHYAVGLFNIGAHWNFLDIPRFAVGASAGFTYGHGAWIWIVNPLAKEVLQDTDLITVPFAVTASGTPLDWLQLDLSVNARFGTIWGTLGGELVSANAELAAHQVSFQPGFRVFISDATAFEFSVDLPVYTWVPWEGTLSAQLRNRGWEKSGEGGAEAPFAETWKLEGGVRSRVTPWLFLAMRLHYGRTIRWWYLTTVNPSLSAEFRF